MRFSFPVVSLLLAGFSLRLDLFPRAADSALCRKGGCRYDQIFAQIDASGNDLHSVAALLVEDPVDDLLTWLADPEGFRARWQSEPGRWDALRSRCKGEHGFDPERDGELAGAPRGRLPTTDEPTLLSTPKG